MDTISTKEFKSQTGKYLRESLKKYGFIGSGFHYRKQTSLFVFVIGLQANRYGRKFCVEVGFHSTDMKTNGFEDLQFSKLKYYDCAFRYRLSTQNTADQWWSYKATPDENLKSIDLVLESLSDNFFPLVKAIELDECHIYENIQDDDIKNGLLPIFNRSILFEVRLPTIRYLWILSKSTETRNPSLSFRFAQMGYMILEDRHGGYLRDDLYQLSRPS